MPGIRLALCAGGVLLLAGCAQGIIQADPIHNTSPRDTPSAPLAVSQGDADPSAPESLADVDLRIDGVVQPGDALESSLQQVGRVEARVDVASLMGGEILVAAGPEGNLSLRFPAHTTETAYPRAAVSVTPVGGDMDALAPQEQPFSFGIDFWVDSVSTGNEVDNGDNMIQRGLASDSSQFKLELDDGKPLCRVAGSGGVVEVKWSETVAPERWYQVECRRADNHLTLSLAAFQDGLPVPLGSTTSEGVTGRLSWLNPETPFSVGGKLAANGAMIQSATDQFNGQLARPVLRIGDP